MTRSTRSVTVLTFGVVLALFGVLTTRFGSAQQANADATPTDFPLLLSGSRALAFMRAADQRLDYLPGEVLVKFKDGVTPAGQQRALTALRSRPPVEDLRWIGDVALYLDQTESDANILATQLRAQPEVAYAEPNYLRHRNSEPNDPGFAKSQWNFKAIDLPRAWDINSGGNDNVIVAVVDSGVTTVNQNFTFPTWNGRAIQNIVVPFGVNPDLTVNRLVTPRDFVFWTGPVLDLVSHGSHVASTIAENTNNNLAEAGVAYNVKIMPVKVCIGFWEIQFAGSANGFRGFAPLNSGGCPSDAVAAGIRYAADNGAKVINLSLGGTQPSVIERDALTYAVSKGTFVALAAGNEFEEGNPVEYPAAFAASIDGAMVVSAVGPSLKRAYYSNTGTHVEIAAPGGDFRDGGFPSGGIFQATILDSDSDAETVLFPRFDRYAEMPKQGTSMATPHVSGIAALLYSQGITAPSAIEAAIRSSARDLGPVGRDSTFGFGLIQPRTALLGLGVTR